MPGTRGCRPGRCRASCSRPIGRAGAPALPAFGANTAADPSVPASEGGCWAGGRLAGARTRPPCSPAARAHLRVQGPPSGGAGPCSWFVGLWASGGDCRPKWLQPGSQELPRKHAAPSRTPGINGASTLGSGPRGPVLGAGTGPGAGAFSQDSVGGNMPGGPSWRPVFLEPLSQRACLGGGLPPDQSGVGVPAAPGVCMRVDCRGTIWGAGAAAGRRPQGSWLFTLGARAWPALPPPMFTCVSGSGVPAWRPPRACGAPRRRC